VSTILLCWYALGWSGIGFIAREDGVVLLRDIMLIFLLAPLLVIVFPIEVIKRYSNTVVWRKP
jgi:hypothetical protein